MFLSTDPLCPKICLGFDVVEGVEDPSSGKLFGLATFDFSLCFDEVSVFFSFLLFTAIFIKIYILRSLG